MPRLAGLWPYIESNTLLTKACRYFGNMAPPGGTIAPQRTSGGIMVVRAPFGPQNSTRTDAAIRIEPIAPAASRV